MKVADQGENHFWSARALGTCQFASQPHGRGIFTKWGVFAFSLSVDWEGNFHHAASTPIRRNLVLR
jgi:hypothetical protein